MAGEVKQMVLEYINEYPDTEVPVDDLVAYFEEKLTRNDILSALKLIEAAQFGVLAIGRRGKQTRFLRGAVRIKSQINENAMNLLRQEIDTLKNGDFISLQTAEEIMGCPKIQVLDALKTLQEENVGKFLIGRRGGESRFVKGGQNILGAGKSKMFAMRDPSLPPPTMPAKTSNTTTTTTTTIAPQLKSSSTIANNAGQYKVYNNVLFKVYNVKKSGFNTLADALKSLDGIIDGVDVKLIENKLDTNGYCDVEELLVDDDIDDDDDNEIIDNEEQTDKEDDAIAANS